MKKLPPQPIARLRVIFDVHDPAEVFVIAPDNHPIRGELLRWLRAEIPRLTRRTIDGVADGAVISELDPPAGIGPIMFGGSTPVSSASAPNPDPGAAYLVGWRLDTPGAPDFEWLAAALMRAFPGLTLRFGDVWASAHGLWIFEVAS